MNELTPHKISMSWAKLVQYGWQRFRDYVADFLNWVGIGRIVVTAGGVAIVVIGAWWVMRMPPPPIESSIAYATSTVMAGSAVAASPQMVTPSTFPLTIIVHVAGEVNRPGVVMIAGDSRVVDALSAAGGPTTRADLDAVNLAAPLVDAAQVYVPKRGEIAKRQVPRPVPGVNLPTSTDRGTVTDPSVAQLLDLNTATEQILDTLPGVGPSTARAIIAYRLQHGPFASVDDLLNVRGIGPVKLDALRGLVRV